MSSTSDSVAPVVGTTGNVIVSQSFNMSDYKDVLEPKNPSSAATTSTNPSSSMGGGCGGSLGLRIEPIPCFLLCLLCSLEGPTC